MSLYDVAIGEGRCPHCRHRQTWRVQFKYGACSYRELEPGAGIRWTSGRRRFWDCGRNVGGVVHADGIVENRCTGCGREDLSALVVIRRNVYRQIKLLKEPADLGPEGFEKVK